MTGSMIERVARAIWKRHSDEVRCIVESGWTGVPGDWMFEDQPKSTVDRFMALASAAIAAMREPTDAMVGAGADKIPNYDVERWHTLDSWKTMIDAALADG